jgi:Universal stress protein family/Protein of unknown function (DUF5818)
VKPIPHEFLIVPGGSTALKESGDTPTTILGLAGTKDIDLIVLGTHGHSGLSRVLVGSVAETIVRQAPCPVLSSVRNDDVFTSEFTGEIMDSFCAEDGHHIGVNNSHIGISEAGCTLTCVKLGGAQFVLHDPRTGHTYKLDDQEKPEAFAGHFANVVGTYDKGKNTIHVTEIRPVIVNAF